ncbi:MAG: 50S ribosomal protein L11 methyltransferase [Vicinamibacterales bacterium]
MPYRIDIWEPSDDAFERLVALDALDVEITTQGVAALLPDHVEPAAASGAARDGRIIVSPAIGRDDGSVWMLNLRPVRVGRIEIVPASDTAAPEAVQLIDSAAFGTGLHASTALCLAILDDHARAADSRGILDVGTGSGVLALAALTVGVTRAVGVDIDRAALAVAAANARLNGLSERFRLVAGGAESVRGSWPLVVANVLAAPLIEMAPALVQRVSSRGVLVLSGIGAGVSTDVRRAYRRLGMLDVESRERGGWTALVLRASW